MDFQFSELRYSYIYLGFRRFIDRRFLLWKLTTSLKPFKSRDSENRRQPWLLSVLWKHGQWSKFYWPLLEGKIGNLCPFYSSIKPSTKLGSKYDLPWFLISARLDTYMNFQGLHNKMLILVDKEAFRDTCKMKFRAVFIFVSILRKKGSHKKIFTSNYSVLLHLSLITNIQT